MPWYGNGLQGRDGTLYLNSDGIVEISSGFYSLNGGQIIGSVAITEQTEHNSLLMTVFCFYVRIRMKLFKKESLCALYLEKQKEKC